MFICNIPLPLHAPWIELNFNSTKVNSTTRLRFNWKEIRLKLVEKVVGNFLVNMLLEKKKLKKTNMKRHLSMPLYLGKG
jgi:hypothetical protein